MIKFLWVLLVFVLLIPLSSAIIYEGNIKRHEVWEQTFKVQFVDYSARWQRCSFWFWWGDGKRIESRIYEGVGPLKTGEHDWLDKLPFTFHVYQCSDYAAEYFLEFEPYRPVPKSRAAKRYAQIEARRNS